MLYCDSYDVTKVGARIMQIRGFEYLFFLCVRFLIN